MQLPPLSLYIHIPWCIRKCPYCDFNSHESASAIPEADYVQQLLHDLEQDLPLVQSRPLTSIFFGGGTPSLFSATAIAELLKGVADRVAWSEDIEITLEANPGSAEAEKFAGFAEAGINRLSIGVQSFNNAHLQTLGRVHDSQQALAAVGLARQAGINRINLDLMHGLPDQDADSALADLDTAIGLNPDHLSWYQLTIEPNTRFYSHPPLLPEEEALADIQDAGEDRLANAGYQHYEVSAYARDGSYSRHNMNYWGFGDYLGIGAGAHAKLTDLDQQTVTRYSRTRAPADYLRCSDNFQAQRRQLDRADLGAEFMLNNLRLIHGFALADFGPRTGQDIQQLQPRIDDLLRRELLEKEGGYLRTTRLGMRFLDTVVGEFFE
ncbi:radical SAM family heme chaperone HemW [Halieaceae bacterium IMCC14734]|uniref:Heme chaperone HemW n=1 Tax=Candidatus Litorirhabdus singularis TaxID=2518993 RepID=A0ABT3TCM6_9GAMM|nr:radical SAM family heme chaperone HemW [Candidatus Litorirhabdus singularis]